MHVPSGVTTMTPARKFSGLIAAGVVLMCAAAACSRSSSPSMDAGLKSDLAAVGGSSVELAPKAAQPQMVVSAIEGGPTAAPARASVHKSNTPKSVAKAAPRKTETVAQAPQPAPEPVVVAPASAPAPSVEPAPLPPVSRQSTRESSRSQRAGPYKTEAEIFRQMPWIKP